MGKVAANADLFLTAFGRRPVAAGVMVAELDAPMDVVTNGLHSLPVARNCSEECPSLIGQTLGVAVAAAVKKGQNIIRQIIDFPLPDIRRYLIVKTLS